jgi:hypothetical protein
MSPSACAVRKPKSAVFERHSGGDLGSEPTQKGNAVAPVAVVIVEEGFFGGRFAG